METYFLHVRNCLEIQFFILAMLTLSDKPKKIFLKQIIFRISKIIVVIFKKKIQQKFNFVEN